MEALSFNIVTKIDLEFILESYMVFIQFSIQF